MGGVVCVGFFCCMYGKKSWIWQFKNADGWLWIKNCEKIGVVTCESKLTQIESNNLDWVIYVFRSKSNWTNQNRTNWVTSLDL